MSASVLLLLAERGTDWPSRHGKACLAGAGLVTPVVLLSISGRPRPLSGSAGRDSVLWGGMAREPAPRQRRSSVPSTGGNRGPTRFPGILFPHGSGTTERDAREPEVFADLSLGRVVTAIVAGREEYDLTGLFHMQLTDVDDVVFRQEIMRDLESARLIGDLDAFAGTMRAVRAHLARAGQVTHRAAKQRWFADAAGLYGDGVVRLADDLERAGVVSRGLSGFRDHVARYVASDRFRSFNIEAKRVNADLAGVRYRVGIFPLRVEVGPFDGGHDYGEEIDALFARFRQGDVEPYTFAPADTEALNKVDAMILDRVAAVHPGVFARLAEFHAEHDDFPDPAILAFDREIQFYMAFREYVERFRRAGLRFCYPRVGGDRKESMSRGAFDLALAETLLAEKRTVVGNDFELSDTERILVVTGPNQGGKTSFARAFGQIHYLASLGCLVPGDEARLPLCDRIFSHFEREEDVADLSGRLKDDLTRIHAILDQVTPRSVVVINEIFSSTTLRDATILSRKIAERLVQRDLVCVWVTFIDELATLGEQTVSMAAAVDPDRPTERTYRIVRRPANGLAHALSIAEKHRLTREAIERRLKP